MFDFVDFRYYVNDSKKMSIVGYYYQLEFIYNKYMFLNYFYILKLFLFIIYILNFVKFDIFVVVKFED